MNRRFVTYALLVPLMLGAWTFFHIELEDSFPKADQILETTPTELWLKFSTLPDTARSTFSVRGSEGAVALGAIVYDSKTDPTVLRATVAEALQVGTYTVSWVAAPLGDHAVRGRFDFSVGEQF